MGLNSLLRMVIPPLGGSNSFSIGWSTDALKGLLQSWDPQAYAAARLAHAVLAGLSGERPACEKGRGGFSSVDSLIIHQGYTLED